MKIKWIIPALTIAFSSCTQSAKVETTKQKFEVAGKTAVIVTTAKETNLRLTQTGIVEFKKTEQPTEGANSMVCNARTQ